MATCTVVWTVPGSLLYDMAGHMHMYDTTVHSMFDLRSTVCSRWAEHNLTSQADDVIRHSISGKLARHGSHAILTWIYQFVIPTSNAIGSLQLYTIPVYWLCRELIMYFFNWKSVKDWTVVTTPRCDIVSIFQVCFIIVHDWRVIPDI
jgi:hypothetical protein